VRACDRDQRSRPGSPRGRTGTGEVGQRIRDEARKVDVSFDTELGDQRLECASLRAFAEHQQAKLAFLAKAREGAQQRRVVLLAREAPDRQHHGRAVFREPGVLGRPLGAFAEVGRHDGIVEGANPITGLRYLARQVVQRTCQHSEVSLLLRPHRERDALGEHQPCPTPRQRTRHDGCEVRPVIRRHHGIGLLPAKPPGQGRNHRSHLLLGGLTPRCQTREPPRVESEHADLRVDVLLPYPAGDRRQERHAMAASRQLGRELKGLARHAAAAQLGEEERDVTPGCRAHAGRAAVETWPRCRCAITT
jgi:hypothetical protein